MGKVAVTYRLMLEGPDVDPSGILDQVREAFGDSVASSDVQPFAFGLDVLVVVLVMDDAEGVADATEGVLGGLTGVQSVEVSHLSLI